MWKPSTIRVKLKKKKKRVKLKRKKFSIIITPRMTQRFKSKKIDIVSL